MRMGRRLVVLTSDAPEKPLKSSTGRASPSLRGIATDLSARLRGPDRYPAVSGSLGTGGQATDSRTATCGPKIAAEIEEQLSSDIRPGTRPFYPAKEPSFNVGILSSTTQRPDHPAKAISRFRSSKKEPNQVASTNKKDGQPVLFIKYIVLQFVLAPRAVRNGWPPAPHPQH